MIRPSLNVVAVAVGEDSFVTMVTDSVALFALRKTFRPLGSEASTQQNVLDAKPVLQDANC